MPINLGLFMSSLRKFLLVAGLASSLCNGAVAAYIDFTDSISLSGGGSSYTGTVDGISFTLLSNGDDLTFNQNYDGDVSGSWCDTLACVKDGVGIVDDEIRAGSQAMGLFFDDPVRIHSLEFLDLYIGTGSEQATVYIDGSEYLVGANDASGDGGYARLDLLSVIGQNIVFFGNPDDDYWDDLTNDYAFAAASVSAVPIPAAAWLFGTALIGLVGFSKRRKAA